MARIKIPPGLRGTITQTGKNSYRVDLSLGRNAQGKYDRKRETIRGTDQDALDLLIRWNVQYLDNVITVTNYQTVEQAYGEWIKHIEKHRKPNTYKFYTKRWKSNLLPELGHMRLKDLTIGKMQDALDTHPANDTHNKRALRAFMNWCADRGKVKRFNFKLLETQSQPKPKTETDVWNFKQVQKVYAALAFKNLYDIFIVLGIECGLRPQEIMALTWDKIKQDHLVIDTAVEDRTPDDYDLGSTKTKQSSRLAAITPYALDKLMIHRINQEIRISRTKGYDREANLVVADSVGHVPDLRYIRKYMYRVADRAEVHRIPPKNLRSTYISLMADLGIQMSLIQKQVGHEAGSSVTSQHYIRVFDESLKKASLLLHNKLHDQNHNSPSFA